MDEELDDLKSIWKQQPDFEAKNEIEIGLMLKGKSNMLVNKLKRNVWFELIFTVVCILAMAGYNFTLPEGALRSTILSLLVLLISYSVYYVKKIKLLNQYDPGVENMKESLKRLIEKLDMFMKFYKRSYTILYPVFFGLGLLFGAIEKGFDRLIDKFQNPLYSLAFVILSIVFMVGVYTITNWYLKKLYGNHLDKLKGLLEELQG